MRQAFKSFAALLVAVLITASAEPASAILPVRPFAEALAAAGRLLGYEARAASSFARGSRLMAEELSTARAFAHGNEYAALEREVSTSLRSLGPDDADAAMDAIVASIGRYRAGEVRNDAGYLVSVGFRNRAAVAQDRASLGMTRVPSEIGGTAGTTRTVKKSVISSSAADEPLIAALDGHLVTDVASAMAEAQLSGLRAVGIDLPFFQTATANRVNGAIARLSDKQREIIELKMVGYDRTEIAEQLGISESVAKKRLSAAYKALRQHLEQME